MWESMVEGWRDASEWEGGWAQDRGSLIAGGKQSEEADAGLEMFSCDCFCALWELRTETSALRRCDS